MRKRFLSRLIVVSLVFLTSVISQHAASARRINRSSASADSTRSDFLKLIDRKKVSPAVEIKELPPAGEFPVEHFSFAADSDQRVTGLLMKPVGQAASRPVVIVLHGTGQRKEQMQAMLSALAGKGFIGVAIDGRYHGERATSGTGSREYSDAMLRTYKTGKEHPFLYDTVWDVMRLIDYLETRKDVDKSRIGMIGFSKGGMETYLAAAVDPRIAVAVPCIGVQSFKWALENDKWQYRVETFQTAIDRAAAEEKVSPVDAAFIRKFYDRVMPGIYGEFDGPAMLPLIAPRPLLVINGDSDNRTPIPGLQECAAAARKAYTAAHAEDRFVLHIQEKTGHAVNAPARQAAIDWFVKWLKP